VAALFAEEPPNLVTINSDAFVMHTTLIGTPKFSDRTRKWSDYFGTYREASLSGNSANGDLAAAQGHNWAR
jgi:hypothetical protein